MHPLVTVLCRTSVLAAILGLTACADDRPSNSAANFAYTSGNTRAWGEAMNQSGVPGAVDPSYTGRLSGPGPTEPRTSGDASALGVAMMQGREPRPDDRRDLQEVANLDDSQMAAVLVALCKGQVQEAQLAQSRAQSSAVRTLADHVLLEHQGMLDQSHEDLAVARVLENDNSVSRELFLTKQADLSKLLAVNAKDFDRAYVDAQVQDHTRALDLIDRMMARVGSPDLFTSMQRARASEESHLRDATALQPKLLVTP